MSAEVVAPPTVQSSKAEVWYLKEVKFQERPLKIVTQNFNGPCSFIAICNILILRGNIEILPRERQTVSYEFLSQLVAEYLLTSAPDVDISAALSILPETQKGLDLNPLFTSSTSFRPPTSAPSGELQLFSQVGVPLVHGWLVHPESPEAPVLQRVQDYDSAVNLIAEADHITDGRLVGKREGDGGRSGDGEKEQGGSSSKPREEFSEEQRRKVEDALVVRQFLNTTWSQLTYHGLFHLASTLPPGSLNALFRSSHLSVLYKAPSQTDDASVPGPSSSAGASSSAGPSSSTAGPSSYSSPGPSSSAPGPSTSSSSANPSITSSPPSSSPPLPSTTSPSVLYTLVTDHAFLLEPTVVWERLEDVDGGSSTFVDADFRPSAPAGGDWAGQTAEDALRRSEGFQGEDVFQGIEEPNDRALARQLQAEEDAFAREQHALYLQEQQRRRDAMRKGVPVPEQQAPKMKKKKSNCIIM